MSRRTLMKADYPGSFYPITKIPLKPVSSFHKPYLHPLAKHVKPSAIVHMQLSGQKVTQQETDLHFIVQKSTP
jgi:hypothetical protein